MNKMIKNNLLAFSFCMSIVLLACGSEAGKAPKSILSGKITGMTTNELYLLDLLQPKAGPVDTALIQEDGSFSFDYEPANKGFFRITLSQNYALVLPLALGETVKISGDVNDLNALEISGTDDAVQMKKMNALLGEYFRKSQELEQEFQQYANSPNKDSIINIFRDRYQKIEAEKTEKLKSLIDDAPSLFANLAVIEQMPASETEYYKKVDEALANKYGKSLFYTNFHAKVVEISRFAVGSEVPEINLPDPNGNYPLHLPVRVPQHH